MSNKIYKSWRDYPKSQWRWPDFSPQEMACRGTGKLLIVPEAMDKLQALRTKLGKPMIVNSAYRSPEHNRSVGGASQSKHMRGLAFDVRMENHDPEEYIAAALAVGFNGIGTYPRQNFIHVDVRPSRGAWGQPFPKRAATPSFAIELPREPESVAEDGEAKGALVGLGGAVAGAGGVLSAIGSLDPIVQAVAVGGLVIAGLALVYLFRKRLARMAQ
jgi:zinc D-Ala-D-Ala carboxypeptidase